MKCEEVRSACHLIWKFYAPVSGEHRPFDGVDYAESPDLPEEAPCAGHPRGAPTTLVVRLRRSSETDATACNVALAAGASSSRWDEVRARQTSSAMSRPCAVRAQITVNDTATMMIAQIG